MTDDSVRSSGHAQSSLRLLMHLRFSFLGQPIVLQCLVRVQNHFSPLLI